MSAAYVRGYYGVDYKRGDRVTVNGRPGRIVSFPGQYLGVRFNGQKFTSIAHPTWRVARIPEDCPTCGGTGTVPDRVMGRDVETTCPDCVDDATWALDGTRRAS